MTMEETAEDFFDPAYDELTGATDADLAFGALALTVHQDGYFRFGGVDLQRRGKEPYYQPIIRFLVYSDPILKAVAQGERPVLPHSSVSAQGDLGDLIIFTHDTDAELRAHGADPQFIGLVISGIGRDLLDKMDAEIARRFGVGVQTEEGTYWQDGTRYIVLSEAQGAVFIYGVRQVWQDCLYLGQGRVLDVGACDRAAFDNAAPFSYRTP